MTSRAGRDSVYKRRDIPAQQTLAYLESLPDLSLSVHAADAANEDSMRSVIASLSGPIGGCMLLSAVLTDRMFSRHSKLSYMASFPSKVGAFTAIEKAVHIPSLDFLIAFTSISSLFGNAGQTNYARYMSYVASELSS
jgi:hypothetical protein